MINLLQQKTLLYAEDDKVTQALYKDYFEQHFKKVYYAENGQQALKLYQEKIIDVIFLDINMPVMNGFDFCKKIRKDDKTTKIVLLTAREDQEALLTAVELGLITYLIKPVSRVQLKQVLIKIAGLFKDKSRIMLRQFNDQEIEWNMNKRELYCDSQQISLTKNEKLLLELLISSRHDKINNQQIIECIRSNDDRELSENAIKTLVKRLRSKLPPETIKNVYGLGYFLNRSTEI